MKPTEDLATTPFLKWRLQANLSIPQAARALAKTEAMIRFYDRGIYKPPVDTLMLMAAAARGIELRPWPQ
jgi:hypothetical protein